MLEKYADLLTVKEIAEILRVSKAVIYEMIKDDKIKVFKFGREYKCPKTYIISRFFS